MGQTIEEVAMHREASAVARLAKNIAGSDAAAQEACQVSRQRSAADVSEPLLFTRP